MAISNPYASPETPPEPDRDERFVRRYLPLLAGGLLVGCGVSAVNPMLGVPLTLFAMPALLRGTRIYWRKRRAAEAVSLADWGLLVFVSLFIATPVSFFGFLAFCCVCTPVAIVGISAIYPGGDDLLAYILLYTAVYLGLAAGLFASFFLLNRLHYLSEDEKQVLQQAELNDTASDEPP